MFIGVEQIILYENGEFYLELGAGGIEGKYSIVGDTIKLNYFSKPSLTWPDMFIMTEKYFQNVKVNDSIKTIKIPRQSKGYKTD